MLKQKLKKNQLNNILSSSIFKNYLEIIEYQYDTVDNEFTFISTHIAFLVMENKKTKSSKYDT